MSSSNCSSRDGAGIVGTKTNDETISNRVKVHRTGDESLSVCHSLIVNVQLELSTVLAEEIVESQKITGLICRGVNETIEILMPRTYTRHHIPASSEQIPRPESAQAWPHLENIAEKLMPYQSDIEVGLLIGTSCIRVIKPREIIMGGNEDPYGKRTDLGWGIFGAIQPSKNKDCEVDHGMIFVS